MARPAKEKATARRATSAEQWRKNNAEVFTFTLSSGNVVDMVPVQMDKLIQSGKIPNLLTPLAAKTLWQDPEAADKELMLDAENTVRYMELVNIIVPAAVVNPKIRVPLKPVPGDKPQAEAPLGENELWIDELSFIEKVEIFKLCVQPSEVLRYFRDKQAGNVGIVPDGQDVESKT